MHSSKFCHYNKVVGIQKLPRHTSTLARQSFQHKYEKQGAENRYLMCTIYMPWMTRTAHFSTPKLLKAYQRIFLGTPSNSFSRSTKVGKVKCIVCSDILLLQLEDDENGISDATTWHKAKLHDVNVHHLSNEGVQHTLQQLHNLTR